MASRGVNKVILVGNLGRDPDVKFTQRGGTIAHLAIATSESWQDKQTGEKREKTEWHRVTMYDNLAEIAAKYLRKGSQVYIEGQLQTQKWQDKDGQDRYTTEIAVKGFNGVMQMLGGRDQGPPAQQPAPQSQGQPAQQRPAAQQQPAAQQGQQQYPQAGQGYATSSDGYNEPPMDFDDDIPF